MTTWMLILIVNLVLDHWFSRRIILCWGFVVLQNLDQLGLTNFYIEKSGDGWLIYAARLTSVFRGILRQNI